MNKLAYISIRIIITVQVYSTLDKKTLTKDQFLWGDEEFERHPKSIFENNSEPKEQDGVKIKGTAYYPKSEQNRNPKSELQIDNCPEEPIASSCKCRSRYEIIPSITCSPYDLCIPNEGFDNEPKCRTLKKCSNSTFSGEKCICGNTKMICKDDSRCDLLVGKCLPECKMFQKVMEDCICPDQKNEKCHSGDECLIYDNYYKKFDNNCAVPPMDRCSNICKSKDLAETYDYEVIYEDTGEGDYIADSAETHEVIYEDTGCGHGKIRVKMETMMISIDIIIMEIEI